MVKAILKVLNATKGQLVGAAFSMPVIFVMVIMSNINLNNKSFILLIVERIYIFYYRVSLQLHTTFSFQQEDFMKIQF